MKRLVLAAGFLGPILTPASALAVSEDDVVRLVSYICVEPTTTAVQLERAESRLLPPEWTPDEAGLGQQGQGIADLPLDPSLPDIATGKRYVSRDGTEFTVVVTTDAWTALGWHQNYCRARLSGSDARHLETIIRSDLGWSPPLSAPGVAGGAWSIRGTPASKGDTRAVFLKEKSTPEGSKTVEFGVLELVWPKERRLPARQSTP